MSNKEMMTKAELMMQGLVVSVVDCDLTFIVRYILSTLGTDENSASEIVTASNKYNSNNTPVSHMTVNSSGFGNLITFVRDEDVKTSKDLGNVDGVLCYVYNLTYPDCSELGYSYFEEVGGGFYKRIA